MWKISSSVMWRRVDLVKTGIKEEALSRATRLHIPQDCILRGHRRENIESYRLKYVCSAQICVIRRQFSYITDTWLTHYDRERDSCFVHCGNNILKSVYSVLTELANIRIMKFYCQDLRSYFSIWKIVLQDCIHKTESEMNIPTSDLYF
jgi:hypothetical protein